MSSTEERGRMLTKEIKGNLGPCMITFSIPLVIPGITLTMVAFGDEPGIPIYGSVHILGIVVLIISIVIFVLGCVFRCSFKAIRISPIEEIHTVVTTRDTLNCNGNNSNDYQIKKSISDNVDNNKRIFQDNVTCQSNLPSTSTSSSIPKNKLQKSANVSEVSPDSESAMFIKCDKHDECEQNNLNKSIGELVKTSKDNEIKEQRNEHGSEDIQQNNTDVPNTDLYPLGRLPSLDLKHTKYSYSSQDKPDEEMSIVDETNDPCNSPDVNPSAKRHLDDLPDIYGERRKMNMFCSNDNTSYTSTESISGHIIRTNREEYQRRDSEHFSY